MPPSFLMIFNQLYDIKHYNMAKKKVIIARLIKYRDDDGSFDHLFWQRIGPRGIFEAMCQMVIDHSKWRKDVDPPRLRRSVAVLKRKKR